VTAAVNAAVQPLLERYIARLCRRAGRARLRRDLLVMNGNGGMVSAAAVSRARRSRR
jgi:N-methylhydantoinase A